MESARSNWLLSANVVRTAVKESLELIWVTQDNYSPVSMQRGGVLAVIAGNVSETLWKLQSGHHSVSWQHYADLDGRTRMQLQERGGNGVTSKEG
eukprot:470176-Rhodomonas_salina.1